MRIWINWWSFIFCTWYCKVDTMTYRSLYSNFSFCFCTQKTSSRSFRATNYGTNLKCFSQEMWGYRRCITGRISCQQTWNCTLPAPVVIYLFKAYVEYVLCTILIHDTPHPGMWNAIQNCHNGMNVVVGDEDHWQNCVTCVTTGRIVVYRYFWTRTYKHDWWVTNWRKHT